MIPPTCPRHGHPLRLLEEGVLNGVVRRYWGLCPGETTKRVMCVWHKHRDQWKPFDRCSCGGGVQQPCHLEVVVDAAEHEEPDLFGGAS